MDPSRSSTNDLNDYFKEPYDPFSPDYHAEALCWDPNAPTPDESDEVINPRTTLQRTKILQQEFLRQIEEAARRPSSGRANRPKKIAEVRTQLNELTREIKHLKPTQQVPQKSSTARLKATEKAPPPPEQPKKDISVLMQRLTK